MSGFVLCAAVHAQDYAVQAIAEEQKLDFTAAERDWNKYVEVAADKGAARLALADYYHRRLEPLKEFNALAFAAREYAPDAEKLLPVLQQRPSRTYERLFKLIDDQQLDPELGVTQSTAWILRYPEERSLYIRAFRYALEHNISDAAVRSIQDYQKKFPADDEFPVTARAELAAKTGSTAQAIEEYERSFKPLWAPELV